MPRILPSSRDDTCRAFCKPLGKSSVTIPLRATEGIQSIWIVDYVRVQDKEYRICMASLTMLVFLHDCCCVNLCRRHKRQCFMPLRVLHLLLFFTQDHLSHPGSENLIGRISGSAWASLTMHCTYFRPYLFRYILVETLRCLLLVQPTLLFGIHLFLSFSCKEGTRSSW
jgi:hypothetical protein